MTLLPGLFNADLTLGAIEIGVLVSTFLFGIVTVQTYIYVSRFPKDPIILRSLVAFVWLLELGHSICICHALYAITVSQYGRPQLLDIPPQSLNVAVLFSGFIGPIEQGWFAHRIYKFSGKLFLPIICLILVTLRWFGSIAISVVAFHRLTVEVYLNNWSWLLTTILVIGAGTDVILAAALCYHLKEWRDSAFKRTSRMVDRLMVWSIETGLLTSIAAIALLACFLTMRTNFIWIGVFSILARLFSNAFLASLNARPALAQLCREDILPLSTARSEGSPNSPTTYHYPGLELASKRSAPPKLSITIQTQQPPPPPPPPPPLPSQASITRWKGWQDTEIGESEEDANEGMPRISSDAVYKQRKSREIGVF